MDPAKHVMNAASQNLFHLHIRAWRKISVIIGKSARSKTSAKRIMFGKTLNAGQICSSRYVVIHKDQKEDFVNESKIQYLLFSFTKDNDDYTSIINENTMID